ncbi:SH3 domain-containing protein [Cyanobium sp. HWJ4-Hawea]|uniref:SH3 domain-containing protein n=1 Tax=Cyanobium sp. HWJ4-Hawea TaxID=2823713 RepID=UPI0020CE945C|nr:SH3 domain-containing protein [Cyanobium sp. HWJ4-Hawea]MCP9808621.1 SH3 domain-containing protein [Cyanobium sp. HWJ4-Hawea]
MQLRPIPAWRWVALLGFALLAPAGLPAGGADRRQPEVRRRQSMMEPLLSEAPAQLLCAPRQQAPALAAIGADAPLRVLRHWQAPGGERWLQVELADRAGLARRGWLPA